MAPRRRPIVTEVSRKFRGAIRALLGEGTVDDWRCYREVMDRPDMRDAKERLERRKAKR